MKNKIKKVIKVSLPAFIIYELAIFLLSDWFGIILSICVLIFVIIVAITIVKVFEIMEW